VHRRELAQLKTWKIKIIGSSVKIRAVETDVVDNEG
jgi:hypothetical protein